MSIRRTIGDLHLCDTHQGDLAHYDSSNCRVCKLSLQVAALEAVLEAADKYARTPRFSSLRDERMRELDEALIAARGYKV